MSQSPSTSPASEAPGVPPSAPRTETLTGAAASSLASLLASDTLLDLERLLASPDTIWQSCELSVAHETGMINCLQVRANGSVTMYVCKPNTKARADLVQNQPWDITLSPKEVDAILEKNGALTFADQSTPEWKGPDGAIISDVATAKVTPGAVFTIVRSMQLTPDIQLVWSVKHTNPTEAGKPYTIEDTLKLERRVTR